MGDRGARRTRTPHGRSVGRGSPSRSPWFERGRARQLDRVQDAVNSRAAQGARGLCNVSDMISPVAAVATVAKDD